MPHAILGAYRIDDETTNIFIFFLYFNRFRKAFLLFLREPFGKSQPDMTSKNQKATRNLTCKTEEHDIYNTYL